MTAEEEVTNLPKELIEAPITETAGYVWDVLNKPETVPILSMLEKNAIADQVASDEAFKRPI